ncbi:Methyltransferase domain-containing protein [Gracilibacillus orientalis]|uniref:Methyltransferase domain-containing protein n=1 Tax=Gracilibacillus orientalis TaxID=334253 RepID=A0A1I4GVA3_9BACI|nr:class I SAM-dependent methyltransferase [Gracilibacillus orientalis]SFL33383.1 Methyltransferase domain-containing protein [Gracilibacillus orientalis]
MEQYGVGIFSQDHEDESDRLKSISETFDHVSFTYLKTRGLIEGGRYLDVGAGNGSIAKWLAEQPELRNGEVVAVDRDIRELQTQSLSQRYENLRIAEYDVTQNEEGYPFGMFDMIHARLVLMHLRNRAEVLKKLTSWVKPGGWIILSDSLDLTTQNSNHEPYRKLMSVMWPKLKEVIGSDIEWAPTVPQRLRDTGFHNIGMEAYLPSLDNQSPSSVFWKKTWYQFRDELLKDPSINMDTLKRAEEILSNKDFTELSPGILTVWGKRP